MAKKKIVVLTTGGTIAGVGESGKDTGYTSGALSGEALVASVPELADYAEVSVEEVCNINSDDMTDRIWIQLSRRVAELQEDESVDGIVITHGTDTMDETAYFLSLTVKCEKAVILTGSMKPATSKNPDGPANLLGAVRAAAKNKILVNFHGMYKPTGMNRTWPNQINREGIMGNEMCKFNAQITPVHTATLPFTRYLLGPADFTPGSFGNVHLKDFKPQSQRGHRYGDETDHRPIWAEEIGTRTHALALCFAYDSPLLTLCDWPERYRGAPGAEALKNPPTVWRSTTPLAGAPASHYAVAREAFDGRIYLAALTVEARRLELPLSFLGEGEYEAEFFLDDSIRTPTDAAAISVSHRAVRGGGTLSLDLCAEGGALVIFTKKH